MLVGEDLMEAAGEAGLANLADFLNGRSVREAGHVEHDGTQVHVRSTRLELKCLDEVVASLALEIRGSGAAGAFVELGVRDRPRVDDPRLSRILEVYDVKPAPALRAGDVGVRARKLLLDLDVLDLQLAGEREVGEDRDVGADLAARRV